MNKKLIISIQKNLYQLTNKRIAKKEIIRTILPIYDFLDNSKTKMFLISGSQGIGKTTILKVIRKNFYTYFGKRILALSLDDFYYTKEIRKKLSKKIHPLMLTRGVPGTHDIKKILNIIEKFRDSKYPIKIPIFDKLKDSRINKKRIIYKKADILILEGWCCGTTKINSRYLLNNINHLEEKLDKKFIWRNYYNNKLKYEYKKLFDQFHGLIYFRTSTFSNVFKWRMKQEMKMINNNNKIGMNKSEIGFFIQHYEKITKWMMKSLPKKANITLIIDKNQKIKKINLN